MASGADNINNSKAITTLPSNLSCEFYRYATNYYYDNFGANNYRARTYWKCRFVTEPTSDYIFSCREDVYTASFVKRSDNTLDVVFPEPTVNAVTIYYLTGITSINLPSDPYTNTPTALAVFSSAQNSPSLITNNEPTFHSSYGTVGVAASLHGPSWSWNTFMYPTNPSATLIGIQRTFDEWRGTWENVGNVPANADVTFSNNANSVRIDFNQTKPVT